MIKDGSKKDEISVKELTTKFSRLNFYIQDFENKIKELRAKQTKLEQEKAHIKYVMKSFGFGLKKKNEKIKVYSDILKEDFKCKNVKANQILIRLHEKGYTQLKPSANHLNLSLLAKNPLSKVKRVSNGIYKYG